MKKYFFYFSCLYLFILLVLVTFSFFWSEESLLPNAKNIFLMPSLDHYFGTDSLGRDLFCRIVLGARVSLIVGIFGAMISLFLGLGLGLLAGSKGGLTDRLLMRMTDIFLALPSFAFVAILSLFFQSIFSSLNLVYRTFLVLALAVGFSHWMNSLRVIRSQVIQIKNLPYLEAARALGGTGNYILRKHFLPNLMPTILVLLGLQIPTSILYESFMSFIGLGVQAPMTSWGVLVSEGWKMLSTYPNLILAPSVVIFLTVFSFHGIIDYFQDQSNHQKWLP